MAKDEPGNENATKKGYNENNPAQPQGAFPPDSKNQAKPGDEKSLARDKHHKEKEEEKKPIRRASDK